VIPIRDAPGTAGETPLFQYSQSTSPVNSVGPTALGVPILGMLMVEVPFDFLLDRGEIVHGPEQMMVRHRLGNIDREKSAHDPNLSQPTRAPVQNHELDHLDDIEWDLYFRVSSRLFGRLDLSDTV